MEITLKKALKVNGEETKKINLDFESITGRDLIDAEKVMRAMGDTTPSAFLSMNFHAIVAAKLIGVPVDDLFDMNATDFKNITVAVAGFLLA